jgi:hypothetical protein
MPQRFDHAFCSIERADLGQDVGRVSPLTPTCFEPAVFFAESQHRVQEAFFSGEGHQTRPKFTQDRLIKSRISQFQTQGILPVEPTAHRISSLPIGQILHQLEDAD